MPHAASNVGHWDTAAIFADFSELKAKIRFSQQSPTLEAREDIKIRDRAPVVPIIDCQRAGRWARGRLMGRRNTRFGSFFPASTGSSQGLSSRSPI
jgi:hypothetical protein